MGYQLGIDLGTTYTAAAVSRATQTRAANPEMVSLGDRAVQVPSVVFLAGDGTVLVGEAAQRRALTDPDRVVREFKRRVGDATPVLVGGASHLAHDLVAQVIAWVVARVAEREGGPARRIAVTYPASWGSYKKELVSTALAAHGLAATFLTEPQAAALSYASAERVEAGSTVAVYDLGGGTFDAAVVRKNGGFELLGRPEGVERLGGLDFDEAVFEHVRGAIGDAFDELDPDDEATLAAVSRLRRECTEAKEALSADTEVTIPVLLPGRRTSVRLVRGEFEAMIRPQLEESVQALRRAVTSAGLAPADLSAILLVGGSSRIPLVSQLISAELDRPVAVDADPKHAIALGAALAVSPRPATSGAAPAGSPVPPSRSPASQAPIPPFLGSTPPAAPPDLPRPAPASPAGFVPAGAWRADHRTTPPPAAPAARAPGSVGEGPLRPAHQPPAFAVASSPSAGQARPGQPRTPSSQGPREPLDHTRYYEPAPAARRRPGGLMVGAGGFLVGAALLSALLFLPDERPDPTDVVTDTITTTAPAVPRNEPAPAAPQRRDDGGGEGHDGDRGGGETPTTSSEPPTTTPTTTEETTEEPPPDEEVPEGEQPDPAVETLDPQSDAAQPAGETEAAPVT